MGRTASEKITYCISDTAPRQGSRLDCLIYGSKAITERSVDLLAIISLRYESKVLFPVQERWDLRAASDMLVTFEFHG